MKSLLVAVAAVTAGATTLAEAATSYQYWDTSTSANVQPGSGTFGGTDWTINGTTLAAPNTGSLSVFAGSGATASVTAGVNAGSDAAADSSTITFSAAGTLSGMVFNNIGYAITSNTAAVASLTINNSTSGAPSNANTALWVAASKSADFYAGSSSNTLTLDFTATGFGSRVGLDSSASLNINSNVILDKNAGPSRDLVFGQATSGGTGTINLAGTIRRSVAADTGELVIGNNTGTIVVNVNGGTISTAGTGASNGQGAIALSNTNGATGVLNINSGGFVSASDASTGDAQAGIKVGGASGGVGIVNLNGGSLSVQKVFMASGATGTFEFNGGTITPVVSTTAFMSGLTAANVGTNGANIDTGAFNVTIGQVLSHDSNVSGADGGLNKYGPGILSLAGANTYTGTTNVNAGTLSFTTSTSSIGAVVVKNGAGLSIKEIGTGTANLNTTSITFGTNAATNLGFDFNNLGNPTSSLISSSGALTLNGAVNVSLLNLAGLTSTPNNTTVPLLTYSSQTGAGAFNLLTSTVGHNSFALNDTGTTLFLNITTGTTNTWVGGIGGASGTWDINTTKNWNASDQFYLDGDIVQFDDTATRFNVNIAQTVSPTSVTFLNNSNTYTFTGGTIAGSGTLAVTGTGTVVLDNVNAYTGTTTINSGATLRLGDGTTGHDGTINGTAGVTNNGALIYNRFGSDSASYTISGSGSVTLLNGTQTLSGNNSYSGGLNVSNGTLIAGSTTALGTGTVTVGATGFLDVSGKSVSLTTLNSSGTIANNGASLATLTIGSAGGTSTVSGNILNSTTGTGSIAVTKTGSGTLVLSGSNSFTGQIGFSGSNTGTIVLANSNAVAANSNLVLGSTSGNTVVWQSSSGNDALFPINSNTTFNATFVSDVPTAGPGINHTLGVGTFGGGTLNYTAGPNVISGTASFSQAGIALTAGSTQTNTLNPNGVNVSIGTINSTTSTHTLDLDGNTTGNIVTGNVTVSGGTLNFSKTNSSTWTLGGNANSINGTFSISGGTLELGNGTNSTGNLALTTAGTSLNNSGGTLVYAPVGTATAAYPVTGGGTLIVAGPGTLSMSAGGDYSGPTNVNGGVLALTGSASINSTSGITLNGGKFLQNSSTASTPAITVNSGTVDGTGTAGPITFASGASSVLANGNGSVATFSLNAATFSGIGVANLNIDGANTSFVPVTIANNLTTDGAGTHDVTLNIGGSNPVTAGNTYTLFTYSGLSGGTTDFGIGTFTGYTSRSNISYTLADTGTALTLTINSISSDNPRWSGLDGSAWQIGSTGPNHNWKLVTAGTTTDYRGGDIVTFNDLATGTTTVSIAAADVMPTSTQFSNATKTYTITGPHGIAGAGTVTVSGGGTVNFNNTDTYTGPTNITSGTLVVNGSVTATAINNSGNLVGGASGNIGGTSSVNTSGLVLLQGSNTYSGGTTINNTGTLQLGDGTNGHDGVIVNSGSVSNNGVVKYNRFGSDTASYQIVGSGSVIVSGGHETLGVSNSYTGGTWVSGGTLTTGNVNALAVTGAATINSGVLDIGGLSLTMGTLSGSGGMIVNNSAANSTLNLGGVGTTSTAINGTYAGAIADTNNGSTGTLNLAQNNGLQILTGSLTFTGAITVGSNGTLSVASLDNGGSILLAGSKGSGALVYTGAGNVTNRAVSAQSGVAGGNAANLYLDQSGTGLLWFNNNIWGNNGGIAHTITLQGSSAGSAELDAAMNNANGGGNTLSVVKAGTGLWTLGGTCTYTGPTTVSGGTLDVLIGITGTPTVTIDASSTPAATLILDAANALGSTTFVSTLAGTGTPKLVVNQSQNFAYLNNTGTAAFNNGGTTIGSADGTGTIVVGSGASLVATSYLNHSQANNSGTVSLIGAGTNTIGTLAGPGLYSVGSLSTLNVGTAALGSAAFNSAGTINVSAGSANIVGTIDGAGTLAVSNGAKLTAAYIRQGVLSVGPSSTAAIAFDTQAHTHGTPLGTSVVSTLSVDPTGTLDLTNNGIVILDTTSLGAVKSLIAQAADVSAGTAHWDMPGITSSTAAGDHSHAIGYALASTLPGGGSTSFNGVTFSDAVIARYTLVGDTGLKGTVDLSDYTKVVLNLGKSNALWSDGNFDYSGNVNLGDYTAVIKNLGRSDGQSTVFNATGPSAQQVKASALTLHGAPAVAQASTATDVTLLVNPSNGRVTLVNALQTGQAVITAYTINSPSQSLLPFSADGGGKYLANALENNPSVFYKASNGLTYNLWTGIKNVSTFIGEGFSNHYNANVDSTWTNYTLATSGYALGTLFKRLSSGGTKDLVFQWEDANLNTYTSVVTYVGAVPEPGSVSLVAVGAMAMLGRRRRRSSK